MLPAVPSVVALLAVPRPVASSVFPDIVEPGLVAPDVEPRIRPRDFDTLCGSVDVVDPVVLVGGFA